MKCKTHKIVVEIVSSTPVTEKQARTALTWVLRQQGVFGRNFMFRPFYSPRWRVRQPKALAYVVGKLKDEGQIV